MDDEVDRPIDLGLEVDEDVILGVSDSGECTPSPRIRDGLGQRVAGDSAEGAPACISVSLTSPGTPLHDEIASLNGSDEKRSLSVDLFPFNLSPVVTRRGTQRAVPSLQIDTWPTMRGRGAAANVRVSPPPAPAHSSASSVQEIE